ncbi:TetR family transcriptional regulator [Mycobacterium colombiense]|uniref:TetR family transcriptional regulator n=1 Tax=Mycobacterium colombiense TaxID=339268 RepID=A0A1A0VE06_9MYCO|nr:TetR family transcriptional regulator [Mycobacterium colombiense]OBB81483.1 TetR family transcriptional regulator [Mycobacterium colombiense]
MAFWAEARRPPGRPAQLSREQIVEAASCAENLDTLTMRELAKRLDVSHSALYRWVKNRDELFDLISDVLIDRLLPPGETPGLAWQPFLARLAWHMHDQFLALPGYATHLSRPHPHNAHSTGRLHDAIVTAFRDSGVSADLAEQSYYIYVTSLISWLAHQENPLRIEPKMPRFDLFLDTLLRGLPAREPGSPRP